MTRLLDEKGNVVDIYMGSFSGERGYSPDWSGDFFKVGGLYYDQHIEGYRVDDVDYCIDSARAAVGNGECIIDTILKPGVKFSVKHEFADLWGVYPGDRFDSSELIDLSRGWATNLDELVDHIIFD